MVTDDSTCFGYLSCFNALTVEELSFVTARTRQVFFAKGETVLKQGLSSPYIVFLTNGLIKIYLEVDRNRKVVTHMAKGGDFISFSAVFTNDINKYSASAITDSELCLIEKEALLHIINNNSDFAFRIISRNWQTENQLLNVISNLSYKQMPGKLASAILYLDEFGYDNIFTNLGRKDIAEFANISVESTVKLLKEFEAEGLISLEGKNIILLKKEILLNISKKG